MEKQSKIYVAGHNGLVGSALIRNLKSKGYNNIIFSEHSELDLTRQNEVSSFIASKKPEYIFLAAAKVGGIYANSRYPADFVMENLQMECNIIEAAYKNEIKKLIFLGSSCIYPRLCPQPIKEEYLLTGSLEATNEAYAIAKIAGLKMCQYYNKQYGTRFISVMPTNLYGPNDNFDKETSHVVPALIRKFHEAKENKIPYAIVWGSGDPLREFLHVDDMADACVYLMEIYEGKDFVNIGSGVEISIRELAYMIKNIIGFEGDIVFDTTKPDGTPRKILDVSKLKSLGWESRIELEAGIRRTYQWYLHSQK